MSIALRVGVTGLRRLVPFNLGSLRFAAAMASSEPSADIDASRLTITQTKSPKPKQPHESLVFGHTFTDHMLEIEYKKPVGWGAPRIVPLHDLSLHPAASVLHYSLECFDGLKAYRSPQGTPILFRPDQHMARFNRSAKRLALPQFNEGQLLECMKKLISIERDWIPSARGYSLYIRPTLIGTTPLLGVQPASSALLYVILSPVGPYYREGFKAVKLLAEEKYCRAFPGGTGDAKVGGNYALSILPALEAAQKGYTQVLWLFGPDQQVTEVGTMNMFVFWKNENGERELVTAPLDGTILPGVTRDSVLQLARTWGEFKVSERPFTMHQVIKALQEGRLYEAFGSGTAAVVSPVSAINFKGTEYAIPLDGKDPTAQAGPLARRLSSTIMGIQYGEVSHPWTVSADV